MEGDIKIIMTGICFFIVTLLLLMSTSLLAT